MAELVDPFAPVADPSFMDAATQLVNAQPPQLVDPFAVPAAPAPVAPAQLAPPVQGGQGGSVGLSWSGTPVSDRALAAKGLKGDYAREEEAGRREYEAGAQQLSQGYAERAGTIASPEQVASAPTLLSAEQAKMEAQGRAESEMASMYAGFQAQEQAATQAAQRLSQSAMNQYVSSVQEFAAMQVDPGQWWGNLTSGQRAGSLASVFVANFLGVKGVQTTIMPTLNEAIDRNINGQLANIQKAGQAATMFQNVWEMTRAQSATDAEARLRMRGYALAQTEKEIQAELSRYDAPIAQAKAAEAVAILGQERDKNLMELQQVVRGRVEQAKNRAMDKYRADLEAARASAALKFAKEQWQAEQDAKKGVGLYSVQEIEGNVLINPMTGQPEKMILKGTSPEKIFEARTRAAAVRNMAAKVDELRNLVAANGGVYKPEWFSEQVNDTTARRIKALWVDVAAEYMVAQQGSRPSDFDFKKALDVIPIEGILTRGNTNEVLDDRIRQADNAYKTYSSTISRDFYDPIERATAERIQGGGIRPAEDFAAAGDVAAPVRTKVDETFERVRSPQSNDRARFASAEEVAAYSAIGGQEMYRGAQGGKGKPTVPAWFAELYRAAGEVAGTPEEGQFRQYLEQYGQQSGAESTESGYLRGRAAKVVLDRLDEVAADLAEPDPYAETVK